MPLPATGRSASRLVRSLVALLAVGALGGCVDTPPTSFGIGAYGISGGNVPQLVAATRKHGPRLNGSKVHAFAGVNTRIAVTFKPRQIGKTCRYDPGGKVVLQTFVVVPKWREQAKASPELSRKWDLITQYAIAHELVHIRIEQRHARLLETAFRSLAASDCKTLEAMLKREDARLDAVLEAENRAFDAQDYPRFATFIALIDAY